MAYGMEAVVQISNIQPEISICQLIEKIHLIEIILTVFRLVKIGEQRKMTCGHRGVKFVV
jgi:hypothetical protein